MSGQKGPLWMGHNGPAQYALFSPPSSTFFVPTRLSHSPDLSFPRPSSAIPNSKSPQAIARSAKSDQSF
jgi:hypothetical protein